TLHPSGLFGDEPFLLTRPRTDSGFRLESVGGTPSERSPADSRRRRGRTGTRCRRYAVRPRRRWTGFSGGCDASCHVPRFHAGRTAGVHRFGVTLRVGIAVPVTVALAGRGRAEAAVRDRYRGGRGAAYPADPAGSGTHADELVQRAGRP